MQLIGEDGVTGGREVGGEQGDQLPGLRRMSEQHLLDPSPADREPGLRMGRSLRIALAVQVYRVNRPG